MFTLICVWINGCVNNREAGDLRRYCAHYDVTIMDFPDILKAMPSKWWIIGWPMSIVCGFPSDDTDKNKLFFFSVTLSDFFRCHCLSLHISITAYALLCLPVCLFILTYPDSHILSHCSIVLFAAPCSLIHMNVGHIQDIYVCWLLPVKCHYCAETTDNLTCCHCTWQLSTE